MKKRRRQCAAGFTLVELMIALLVSSVILSAVATLAYATGSAKEATDEMGREQSVLRHVNVRLTDLIKRADGVVSASDSGFELWHDMNSNGVVDEGESTQVTRDSEGDMIIINGTETYTQCENITYQYDDVAPNTRFIAIWFDLDENGQTQRHTINAKLRGSGN